MIQNIPLILDKLSELSLSLAGFDIQLYCHEMIPYIQIVFNILYLIALNYLHKLTEELRFIKFSLKSDSEFTFQVNYNLKFFSLRTPILLSKSLSIDVVKG